MSALTLATPSIRRFVTRSLPRTQTLSPPTVHPAARRVSSERGRFLIPPPLDVRVVSQLTLFRRLPAYIEND